MTIFAQTSTVHIMRPTPSIDKHIAPLFCKTEERPGVFALEMEFLRSPIPVKRSLRIPENMNLGYVQEVLMLAMGWERHHLKEIRCGGITYFTRQAGGEDPEEMEGFPQRDSFQYTLGDLLKLPGDTFTFIYNLGDYWKHIVTLMDIHPYMYEDTNGDFAGSHLIDGQGACPPEDVGGVEGYAEILEDMEETEIDPEFFDLHGLQNRMVDFQRVIGEAMWGFYHR